MLRLRRVVSGPQRAQAESLSEHASGHAQALAQTEIVPVFDDPVLELVRLLREAANIEHALMVQYLFAGFSVKEKYAGLAGGTFESPATIIGVAVQEMRHFADVNSLLVALGAQPNLDREDFPIRSEIYPFALELEPLTRPSVAKYVAAESPLGALDPATAPTQAERQFRVAVNTAVGTTPVNHIGSLYGTIIAGLRRAVAANPKLLPDPDGSIAKLQHIRGEGEGDHFHFFRSVFEGTHQALGDPTIWDNPAADAFPSVPISKNPSAFESSPRTIADPLSRQLGWLADLHYWTVLGLLNLGYSVQNDANQQDQASIYFGRAVSHMIGCLYPLGRLLAARVAGVPFDPIALNFGGGPNRDGTLLWMRRLLGELQKFQDVISDHLALGYSRSAAAVTLSKLGGIV